jgi:hypothetical protein
MIFRLDGNIEEVLALTPVVRGYKELTGERLILTVSLPDLFEGNPFVDSLIEPEVTNDAIIDFNMVEWQAVLKPVCESYMELVLGKHRPVCWQSMMFHKTEHAERAKAFIPEGAVLVSMAEMPAGLMEALAGKGYQVTRLTHKDCLSPHVFRAAVERASFYIGDDGDDTAIAMTTSVPAVVCYTWRSPTYFTPFRRGAPFEAIAPRKEDCLFADGCMMSNGMFECGRTYGVRCQLQNKMVCKKSVTLERIIQAVERIGR